MLSSPSPNWILYGTKKSDESKWRKGSFIKSLKIDQKQITKFWTTSEKCPSNRASNVADSFKISIFSSFHFVRFARAIVYFASVVHSCGARWVYVFSFQLQMFNSRAHSLWILCVHFILLSFVCRVNFVTQMRAIARDEQINFSTLFVVNDSSTIFQFLFILFSNENWNSFLSFLHLSF